MGDVVDSLAELQIFLDSATRAKSLIARIKGIEDKIAIKKGEEGYPTRDLVAKDTAYMVKNKEKITKALGSEKYMDVFSQLVSFLEQNPEKIEKKKKSEDFFGISSNMIASSRYLTYTGDLTDSTRYSLTASNASWTSYYSTDPSPEFAQVPVVTFENPDQVGAQSSGQGTSDISADFRRALQNGGYIPYSPIEEENIEGEEDGGR